MFTDTVTVGAGEQGQPLGPRQQMRQLHEHLAALDLSPAVRQRQRNLYRLAHDGQPVVVVTHPDYAEHVFQHPHIYPKALRRDLPLEDETARLRQLRLLRPQFHRQRLAALCDLMVTTIDEQLDQWHNGEQPGLDLQQAMSHVTLAVLIRTIFGAEVTGENFTQLHTAILDLVEHSPGEESAHLLRMTPALQGSLACYDAAFDAALKRIQQTTEADNSLLALLLGAVDADTGQPLNTQQVRDELLFIFAVGFENIATGLTWSLHLLLQHPAKLAALQQEVDAVLGDELPTLASIGNLRYAGMVLQEALRLKLPVRWLLRRAVVEDQIDGHPIPAGALIVLAAGLFHVDPVFWPDPEVFAPERFHPTQIAQQHPCAWLPFGKGQRFCLGKDFALMEGKLILAMTLQRFDFTTADGFSGG